MNVPRLINSSDLQNILEIEEASFSSPWNVEQFLPIIDKTYLIEDENKTAGFICIEKVLDEVHILHMAVAPAFRGKGIGSALLKFIFSFDAKKFFLEVRESNLIAIKLYSKFGFKTIDKRRNYYQDNNETAIVMMAVKEGNNYE